MADERDYLNEIQAAKERRAVEKDIEELAKMIILYIHGLYGEWFDY